MKRTIKNSAIALLTALSITTSALTPVKASDGELKAHCNTGLHVGGLATITQVKLQDDDNHYEIVIANDYGMYLLDGADKKNAQAAGKIIGERIIFHGTVTDHAAFHGSDNECDLVWLTSYDFAKH